MVVAAVYVRVHCVRVCVCVVVCDVCICARDVRVCVAEGLQCGAVRCGAVQ